MKLNIFWIPVIFWVAMAIVYLGYMIERLLVLGGATKITIISFRILSAYTLLFITTTSLYKILMREIKK